MIQSVAQVNPTTDRAKIVLPDIELGNNEANLAIVEVEQAPFNLTINPASTTTNYHEYLTEPLTMKEIELNFNEKAIPEVFSVQIVLFRY